MHRLILCLALLSGFPAFAQIEVRLKPVQQAHLPGEEIQVAVQISNFSGRLIELGTEPDWIRFGIESLDGWVVNRLTDPPDSGSFKLDTSLRGTLYYDVQPLFDVSTPGRYRLTASVRTASGEEVLSPPTTFDVIKGSRIWEREVGIASDDGQTTLERRKFIVQQANYLRSLKLYVRITDSSESRTFKVLPVGSTIATSRPQFVVDQLSRLHLVHQTSVDDYYYHIIDPDGTIALRQVYVYTDRRPELRVNDKREVGVIGGSRKVTRSDLPKAEPLLAQPTRDDLAN
jgi:hypothetical protein